MNKIVPLDIEKNEEIIESNIVYKKKYKCDCCFDDTNDIHKEYKKCILWIFALLIFVCLLTIILTVIAINNWNLDFYTGFLICFSLSIPTILFIIIFFIHI